MSELSVYSSMNNRNNNMNSKTVADLLGVNISTIKRWTDEGKLGCSKTPGGHRRFGQNDIDAFLDNFPEFRKTVTKIAETRSFGTYLQFENESIRPLLLNELYNMALQGKASSLTRLFKHLYKRKAKMIDFVDLMVIPLLRRLGEDWSNGIITVAQEHIATNAVRESILSLGAHAPDPMVKNPIVFSAVNDDYHDMAVTILSVLARLEGFSVILTGASTPVESLSTIIAFYNPKIIFLSYQYGKDAEYVNREIAKLVKLVQGADTNIYLGGTGISKVPIIAKNVHKLSTIKEGYNKLQRLNNA